MELLRWKTRLSVLWVFMAVGHSAGMFLYLLMPGVLEEVMAGKIGGMQLSEGVMVLYAIFWLIPFIMAVLCLTLKDSYNRWLSFVLAILYILFFIVDIISYLASGESISVALWLIYVAGIVASALIAWFALRWPKQQV